MLSFVSARSYAQLDDEVEKGITESNSQELPSEIQLSCLGDRRIRENDSNNEEPQVVTPEEFSGSNQKQLEHQNDENVDISQQYSCQQKIVGWLCMFLAMMAGALIGPMFKYLQNHGVAPILAASWRCQCMTFLLTPLALVECNYMKKRVDWVSRKPDLRYPVFVHVTVAGLGWAGNLLLWVSALKYTSVIRASLAASMHPLILVLYLRVSGKSISNLEWLGTTATICGMLIAGSKGLFGIYTGDESAEGSNERVALFGDLLGLCSAVCQVVVIMNRHKIKKYVPLFQYSASTTLIVAIVASLIHLVVDAGSGSLLGWASTEWLSRMMIFAAIVGVCIAGYNYAVQFVSPLVFSSCILTDPVLSGVMAYVAGIEALPPMLTWVGGAVVMAGVGAVTLGEYKREEKDKEKPLISSEGHSDTCTDDSLDIVSKPEDVPVAIDPEVFNSEYQKDCVSVDSIPWDWHKRKELVCCVSRRDDLCDVDIERGVLPVEAY